MAWLSYRNHPRLPDVLDLDLFALVVANVHATVESDDGIPACSCGWFEASRFSKDARSSDEIP